MPRDSTAACPRVFTKEQMTEKLKAGGLLYVDRSDATELPELIEMERQGLVRKRLVTFDEQSSALEFWWTAPGTNGDKTR